MHCKVHIFRKKKKIFVKKKSSWSMPQLETLLNLWYVFCLYKYQTMKYSVSLKFLRSLRLPNAFYVTTFFEKEDFVIKHFKLVHAQT